MFAKNYIHRRQKTDVQLYNK